MLEPASIGVPVITGPNVGKFQEITEKRVSAKAAYLVRGVEELEDKVLQLIGNAKLGQEMGKNGKSVVAVNQGGVETTLGIISAFI